MSTGPARARLPLTGSVIALCAVGTAGAVHAGALSKHFAIAFLIAAVLRLFLGRGGRRLLPPRALQLLGCTVSAALLVWLLQTMSSAGGAGALWALMAVMSVYQSLVLLWEQRTFSSFLLILFSSVHATGLAFPAPPAPESAIFVGLYVVALVSTLIVFERAASLERATIEDGAVQRVRADAVRLLPWGATLRMVAWLLVLGVPLGAVGYLVAPRGIAGWFGFEKVRDRRAETGAAAAAGDLPPDLEGREVADATVAQTGPGRGAPLGSVAEIKRSLEPWFEVSLEGGDELPPTVVLRDNAQDHYWQRGLWTETLSQGRPPRVYRDLDDGRSDGWYPLDHVRDEAGAVTLHIRLLRGGQRRFYLQPQATALQLLRHDTLMKDFSVLATENETLRASLDLEAEDVIVQRYVPAIRPGVRLTGRRSDGAVAPQVSYLQVPPDVAEALRPRALEVIGTEQDPWLRAQRLERWLKSEAFTYTLKIPPLDKGNPIVDFVERTRSANCEAFAFALTLMLRTLGHPARYVRGFWGGDVLENRKTVILRGSHYHAWTELYLDGVGWVPLNPTPPDRRPADAGSITAARDAQTTQAPDAGPIPFLGLDEEAWLRLWRRVARAADEAVLRPLASLFAPRTGFVGAFLLIGLIALLRWRRRETRLRAAVVPGGGRPPGGAYGKALLLLARKGVRRPSTWTSSEFARHVETRLPQAGTPFAALTRLHEAERFGGRSRARGDEARWLAALRTSLGR